MKRVCALMLILMLLMVTFRGAHAQRPANEQPAKGSRENGWSMADWSHEHERENTPEMKAKTIAERPELAHVWPGFSVYTEPVPPGKRYPSTYPRPGATKLFENDKVILWNEVMPTGGGDGQMHKHVRDQLSIALNGGYVRYTEVDGRHWFSQSNPPDEKFPRIGGLNLAGNGPHAEINPDVSKGVRHWLWVEFKGTEPKDCRDWSTDPVCNGQPEAPPAAPKVPRTRLPNVPVAAGRQYPPAFPHGGSTRMFESDSIVVWDEILPTNEGVLHKHVRDALSIHLNSGLVKETLADGTTATAQSDPQGGGYPRLEFTPAGSGPHAEMNPDLNETQRHWVWIEFKGTEPKGCKTWSTDPACK